MSRVLELSVTNKALAAEWNDRDDQIRLLVQFLSSVNVGDHCKNAVQDRLLSKASDMIRGMGDIIPDVPDINKVSVVDDL
jgi:hypothetical protein